MRVLFIALLATSAFALPKRSNFHDSKIVGGELATEGQFPYQISFQNSANFSFCGASILDEYTLICAGHCVYGETDNTGFQVVAGSLKRRSDTDNAQRKSVSKITLHENYHPNLLDNDISLLFLSDPFVFNDFVRNVSGLEGRPTIPAGEIATVSGFGTMRSGAATQSEDLRWVDVPIVSEDDCKLDYPTEITRDMVCAGKEGLDSCQGDSGGPLTCPDPNNPTDKTKRNQCGIVSWGIGCGEDDHPGVYTRVSTYKGWIDTNRYNRN